MFFNRLIISKSTRNVLWISTTIFGVYSMYSVTLYYIPEYNYSYLESALYNSIHRLGWSVFTGWIVLACVTSDGGALKNFLSSRALVPLSRLTYCAYLTNGFIELYLAASIRTPKHMSVINLVITLKMLKSKIKIIYFQCCLAWWDVIPRLLDIFGGAYTVLDVWISYPWNWKDAATAASISKRKQSRIRRVQRQ